MGLALFFSLGLLYLMALLTINQHKYLWILFYLMMCLNHKKKFIKWMIAMQIAQFIATNQADKKNNPRCDNHLGDF